MSNHISKLTALGSILDQDMILIERGGVNFALNGSVITAIAATASAALNGVNTLTSSLNALQAQVNAVSDVANGAAAGVASLNGTVSSLSGTVSGLQGQVTNVVNQTNATVGGIRLKFAGDIGNDVAINGGFLNMFGGAAVATDRATTFGVNSDQLIQQLRFRYVQFYTPNQGWVTASATT